MSAPFFNFMVALRAARSGYLVRRNEWTTKWIQFYNGFFWLRVGTDTPRIVRADDLTREDMVAADWTNLPPSCVASSLETQGQTCPLPYAPSDPGGTILPADTTPTGDTDPPTSPQGSNDTDGPDGTTPPTGDTSGNGGSNSGGDSDPPGSDDPFGPGGGGGGGGTGGGGGRRGKPPRSSVSWPTVSVTMDDITDGECYPGGIEGDQVLRFSGSVTLGTSGDTAPGKPAYGGYFVAVYLGGEMLWHGILWPGESQDYGEHETTGIPGQSTFTVRARAYLPQSNSGDITSSASVTMKPWCVNGLAFICDLPGGGSCHEGVGWVTVKAPDNSTLYDGCPGGSFLQMSANQLTAGTTVTVQYSNTAGPCPGGHTCDAAIFRVEFAINGNNAVLGTANLNNGDDGGDRGPFTFTITQAMIDSLGTP